MESLLRGQLVDDDGGEASWDEFYGQFLPHFLFTLSTNVDLISLGLRSKGQY